MATLAPNFTVSLDEEHCETHTKIEGFWDVETINQYFDAVNKVCEPLVKAGKPIYASVDFEGFTPQDRETGEKITEHLAQAREVGLKKVAIIRASALVKLQYRRLSEGGPVEFFDNVQDAKAWLRSKEPA